MMRRMSESGWRRTWVLVAHTPRPLKTWKKEREKTRRVRWADCEDEKGKEEEDQERSGEREKEAKGESETGQQKTTSEKPPGFEKG